MNESLLGFSAMETGTLKNKYFHIQNTTLVKTIDFKIRSVVNLKGHSLHRITSRGL